MAKRPENDNIRLGVLGGGQLCRMMLPYCHRFGIAPHILDKIDAPTFPLSRNFLPGDPRDAQAVLQLGKEVDVITMDREDVNIHALKQLEKQGKRIHPHPEILEIIQDKGLQKKFLQKQGIPTAEFYLVDNKEEIIQFKDQFPLMQKKRKGGYDGQGVFKISDESNLQNAFDGQTLIEEMVDIERELSCIVSRNQKGEIYFFPVVEMVFEGERNILDHLHCPASLSLKEKKIIEDICRDIVNTFDLCGVLAVEFFLAKNGKLMVNEMAPRPHNSGHHTIEACNVSQFEQHLRGVLGLPLAPPLLHGTAITWNLIGDKTGIPYYKGFREVMAIPQVYLHLYGKKEVRPGRKMGHVTIVENNLENAQEKLQQVKNILQVEIK